MLINFSGEGLQWCHMKSTITGGLQISKTAQSFINFTTMILIPLITYPTPYKKKNHWSLCAVNWLALLIHESSTIL